MAHNIEALNNQKDFEQTALPHMDMLRNYALHLTMNSENANDLLQDTYLKAFRFWNDFEKGTNIKAWLYQIMKNSYINQYRKKVKEPKKIEYNENQFYYKSSHHEVSFVPHNLKTKLYNEIFEDEITCSLERLTKDFKTVVLLSDFEEFSYEEIANILECPIGTVRSRLHRGRKQLQKELFGYACQNRYIMKEF
jgi:RNA polymerase sigma-70 factor (ECF subfamily)